MMESRRLNDTQPYPLPKPNDDGPFGIEVDDSMSPISRMLSRVFQSCSRALLVAQIARNSSIIRPKMAGLTGIKPATTDLTDRCLVIWLRAHHPHSRADLMFLHACGIPINEA